MAPRALRRIPTGFREPVAFSPAANRPSTVSTLSASDSAAQVTAAFPNCSLDGGASASTPIGRYW